MSDIKNFPGIVADGEGGGGEGGKTKIFRTHNIFPTVYIPGFLSSFPNCSSKFAQFLFFSLGGGGYNPLAPPVPPPMRGGFKARQVDLSRPFSFLKMFLPTFTFYCLGLCL